MALLSKTGPSGPSRAGIYKSSEAAQLALRRLYFRTIAKKTGIRATRDEK